MLAGYGAGILAFVPGGGAIDYATWCGLYFCLPELTYRQAEAVRLALRHAGPESPVPPAWAAALARSPAEAVAVLEGSRRDAFRARVSARRAAWRQGGR